MVFVFDALPRLFPILRILLIPCKDIGYALAKHAGLGNAAKPRSDNLLRVRFEKCFGVHAADKLTAIHSTVIVHQAPERLTEPYDAVGQAW